MVRLRIIQGADRTDIEVPSELLNATNDQIRSYISETLHRELPEDIEIEKTSEAIIIHPKAVYGSY
jgi:hypothetical protein